MTSCHSTTVHSAAPKHVYTKLQRKLVYYRAFHANCIVYLSLLIVQKNPNLKTEKSLPASNEKRILHAPFLSFLPPKM